METLGTEIGAKKGKKELTNYVCENCNFICSKKYSWDRHIGTAKHTMELNKGQKGQKGAKYLCDCCDKIYDTKSGLWRHKKKCVEEIKYTDTTKKSLEPNTLITPELIMELIKDNKDMKQLIMEQNSTITTLVKNGITTNNSHNNNSLNKTFNLQFFLNETCKDAMNIMDFIDSIQLQLSDLESVGKLGYVEGISNIITTNLKALDITQRPVHCADKKREIIYVKDENKWQKEDETKKKLRRAIRRVAFKNQKIMPKFKEAHPDCLKSASIFSDQYNKILVETMGGSGDNDLEKEDKIIRNISKIVMIQKENTPSLSM